MKLAKISLIATALAFGATQLPFKANIDLPLFYVLSLSGFVLALISIALLIRKKEGTSSGRGRWVWLFVSVTVSVFWIWFWIASLNKHVG